MTRSMLSASRPAGSVEGGSPSRPALAGDLCFPREHRRRDALRGQVRWVIEAVNWPRFLRGSSNGQNVAIAEIGSFPSRDQFVRRSGVDQPTLVDFPYIAI